MVWIDCYDDSRKAWEHHMPMQILITGATGFVGRALVNRLVAEGERPRVLVRDEARARAVFPGDTVDFAVGDVLKPATVDAAMHDIEVVVHSGFMTANLKQHGEQRYNTVNVSGTQNVVDAAKRAGVRRIVVVSGLGTKAAKPGSYMQGRYLAEEAVKSSGLEWSILQPSVQFGQGAAFFVGLANLIRQVPLVVPVAGTGQEQFQPIWIEDVVTCLVKQIREAERAGHSYTVGGPEILTYNQILDLLMRTLGKQKLKIPGPKPFVFLGAAMMEALLPNPPITTAALDLFAFPNADTVDDVPRQFGFAPMRVEDYLAKYGVN